MAIKTRDMAGLSFLVFSKDIPDQVKLKQHTLSFIGADLVAAVGLITGVYGTHSRQTALVAAAKWSDERSGHSGLNRVLMLDVSYRVDNLTLTREQTRPDILESTGWLHLDRIASSFRDEIKETWLDWIRKDTSPGVAARLEDQSLADIALQYPRYVAKMMKKNPSIRAVIHPVNPSLDPAICLWAATVRYEKERFEGALMRYLPQVKVIV